jgi:hypothetical protein
MPNRLPSWSDDLKTGDHRQFTAKLAKAGITYAGFAIYVERDPRTLTRWASGHENIPAYAWAAINKLLAYDAKHREEIVLQLNATAAAEAADQRKAKKLQ